MVLKLLQVWGTYRRDKLGLQLGQPFNHCDPLVGRKLKTWFGGGWAVSVH